MFHWKTFYFLLGNVTSKKEEEATTHAVRRHRRMSLDFRCRVSRQPFSLCFSRRPVTRLTSFRAGASITYLPCHDEIGSRYSHRVLRAMPVSSVLFLIS